jgi:hypothetical protein
MADETREKNAKVWKRDDLDFYVEESRASEALFAVEKFHGAILDPCCGSGNIVHAALNAGNIAVGTDVVRRVAEDWFIGEADFLDVGAISQPNIATNPPFFRGKGTEAFIRKAVLLAKGKVAVFTSIKFLAGATRANGLFAEHCPHRIWIVTPRVSCPPGAWLDAGNKAGGGTDDWVWLVWDMTAPRVTTAQMGWLRKGLFDASLRSRADPLSGASKGRGRRGAPDALQEGIVEEDAGE